MGEVKKKKTIVQKLDDFDLNQFSAAITYVTSSINEINLLFFGGKKHYMKIETITIKLLVSIFLLLTFNVKDILRKFVSVCEFEIYWKTD